MSRRRVSFLRYCEKLSVKYSFSSPFVRSTSLHHENKILVKCVFPLIKSKLSICNALSRDIESFIVVMEHEEMSWKLVTY